MKHYNVQTGWRNKFPERKGNIEILAINRQVAELTVLVDYVDLSQTVKEISANDPVSLSMMPRIPTNLLCGSKNLIAN